MQKNKISTLIRFLMGKYNLSNISGLEALLQNVDPVPIQNKTDINAYGFFRLREDASKLICRTSYAFIPFNITLGTEEDLFILPTFRRKFFGVVNIIFFGLMICVSLTFIANGIAIFALAIGFVSLFFSIIIISTIMEKKFLLRGIKKALIGKSD